MQKKFSSLAELTKAIPNEEAAVSHFTSVRWKNGAFCPYCGSTRVYHFADKRDHKCADCRKRFSIKVGTVMEGTKIEVRKWLMAIWLLTSHKKGIASTQLARDLGVTQKTAWFMLHRLRFAARTRSFNRPLQGEVEIDETFVGGKDGNKHKDKRGTQRKAIVLGMLERDGELRAHPIPSLWQAPRAVTQNVDPDAILMTDDAPCYAMLDKVYGREVVNHRRGQYARGKYHTNSIENFWSLLKRQIYGIHHWVSAKHLAKYVAEASWRFNRRDIEDAVRLNEFVGRLDGRLKYAELIT
jgi:transposase-like protein